jgi:formylglycine-generating enzyme required for sulfatase activity
MPVPACTDVGQTWTRPTDGMTMVCVPAGEFLMGSSDDDPGAQVSEKPQHTVYLDAFWIDKTEVTNAQYLKCVEAGVCKEPSCWDASDYNAPDQPVVCVNWNDARVYSAWAGGQLPTEAEWEKAARGTGGQIYPWGNDFGCHRGNFDDEREVDSYVVEGGPDCDGYPKAAPVGNFAAGASPYGALDMAGNVWEWVADWYDRDYYSTSPASNPQGPDSKEERLSRGGSFGSNDGGGRCAVRFWFVPSLRDGSLGFRVAVVPGASGP